MTALQRFVIQCGVPHTIHSDNAKAELYLLFNQRAFNDQLATYCQPEEIIGLFIPPGAIYCVRLWGRVLLVFIANQNRNRTGGTKECTSATDDDPA